MLYALREPATLLGLVLGFLAGCYLRVVLQRLLLRSAGPLRGMRDLPTWIDPFGVVAVVLSGVGWTPRVDSPRFGSRRLAVPATAAVVAHAALTAAGVAGFLAAGGQRLALPFESTVSVLHGTAAIATTTAQRISLAFAVENLGCGLLCLVPIPPLETGVAVWSRAPRSPGARRVAYHVLHEHWGVAVLLLLLLLPLAGQQPPLLALLGAVGDPILHAI